MEQKKKNKNTNKIKDNSEIFFLVVYPQIQILQWSMYYNYYFCILLLLALLIT